MVDVVGNEGENGRFPFHLKNQLSCLIQASKNWLPGDSHKSAN